MWTSLKNNSLKNAEAAQQAESPIIEYLVVIRSYDHLPDMASFSKCQMFIV
jgi:hypothetical protein